MKKLLVFILLIASAIGLGGCQKQDGTAGQQAPRNDNFRSFEDRRPDFGQPEREADVRGIVKSIIGNEVTIIKLEMPQRSDGTGAAGSFRDIASSGDSQEEASPQDTPRVGAGMGMRPRMGGGFRGEMDEDSRAAMLDRIKEISSGEETVTIPVGIQMLKLDVADTGQQPKMAEASLTDIVQDKMVTIWLDESITDKNVANFVLIMR